MKAAIRFRNQIPFFYDKSAKEMQQDPYERYDPMVIRQAALHLADELWKGYPMQAILDFTQLHLPATNLNHILELGCGLGRWIASLAQQFPAAQCWGIDYSYQMLKQAHAVWVAGKDAPMNFARYGYSAAYPIQGFSLEHLHFGLAKAELLPFEDQSQDLILSSFLLDRLADPIAGLQEMHRLLKPGGRMLLISPLNFSQANHWDQFYPPIKIYQILASMGFVILDWQEALLIEEPLDRRGNVVQWNCVAVACQL